MKSFKQFLSESPYIDKTLDKEGFSDSGNQVSNLLNNNHNKSEKIYDTDIGAVHKTNMNGLHWYYHYVDDKPREISIVNKSNIQRYVNKNGGDGKYIKQIMKYHVKKHGELKSDDRQSVGGMKFWKSLYHEKDPDFSFYHYKKIGEKDKREVHEKHKIDDEYLKNNQNTIWDEHSEKDGSNNRIAMKPNE